MLAPAALVACSTPQRVAPPSSVTVTATQPNVVQFWNDIVNQTVLARSTALAAHPTPEVWRMSR